MVALLAEVATMEADEMGKVAPVARKEAESPDDRDGGPSPMPTSGDHSDQSSPRPSGSDMSSVVVEDRSTPTEEATKPSPRKVTIPEHNVSSYKALEAGLQAEKTDHQSHQHSSAGAAKETATTRGRIGGPPKVITMKSASSSKGSSSSAGGSKKTSLRRGKWTVEEEAYVARVIQDFNYGYLDAPAGTTLRTYLSEKLKCDPMRITKKFTGDACIGKRVFHPAVRSPENASAIDQAQAELDALEKRWRLRLEMQLRESAKKAAASAAVAAAASAAGGAAPIGADGSTDNASQRVANPITQTATWLDRAKSALKEPPSSATQDLHYDEETDLEGQMQEVERLIHEGPVIQQKSAGLPQMLDVPEGAQSPTNGSVSSGDPEPADKRMKTAEDAEALVGFLRSVRASAASGAQL